MYMARQDTTPDMPSHTPGTPRGEDLAGKHGGKPFNRRADDATGINVDDRKPIDPRMPSMPPA
jgi:hypothetical protein